MKVNCFFITALMLILYTGCEKEGELNVQTLTLKSGETFQLKFDGDTIFKKVTSDDYYMVDVNNNGWVIAKHIGSTFVTANGITVEVTVVPQVNIEEPLTEFGITSAQLLSKLGAPSNTLDDPENDYIQYNYTKGEITYSYFCRRSDAKLSRSSLFFMNTSSSSSIEAFLNERYKRNPSKDGTGTTKYLYYENSPFTDNKLIILYYNEDQLYPRVDFMRRLT